VMPISNRRAPPPLCRVLLLLLLFLHPSVFPVHPRLSPFSSHSHTHCGHPVLLPTIFIAHLRVPLLFFSMAVRHRSPSSVFAAHPLLLHLRISIAIAHTAARQNSSPFHPPMSTSDYPKTPFVLSNMTRLGAIAAGDGAYREAIVMSQYRSFVSLSQCSVHLSLCLPSELKVLHRK
jgi:hypothetical protein